MNLVEWEATRRLASQSRALVPAEPEIRVGVSEGVRDPKGATQQLTYSSPGMRQMPEWDADSAIREAYLSSVIVFACVRTRAYAFSGCPLRAVLPGQDVASHNPEAPLARILGPAPGGPNPSWPSRRLWANAVTNKIVTGKFAWELEMPQGASPLRADWAPVRIWPLIARAFDAVPTDGGVELFEYFTYGRGGFAYGMPRMAPVPGEKVRLEPSQVFYCYTPSLNDVRQATSALQAARYDIAADVLQSVYDVAFLRNDMRPAGVIVHEAFEDAAEERSWRQQFEANHRGPQNANRAAFAEVQGAGDKGVRGAIDWVQIGVTQKDAQSLAVHNDKAMRICIALSTPMSLLDASGRTFSNADAETRNWWLDTMLPDLADMEDEINLKLAPRLGPHMAKFDTSHVEALKAPTKFTTISLGDAIDRKVISPKEGREELGYAGEVPNETGGIGVTLVEQAEVIAGLVQAGYDVQTAAKIAGLEPPTKVTPPSPALPAPIPTLKLPAPKQGAPSQMQHNWAASLALARSMRAVEDTQDRRRQEWRAADGVTRSQEGAWIAGLRRLFARQQASALKRLDERKGRWAKAIEKRAVGTPPPDINPDDVFDPAFWQQETTAAVTGLFETLYAASAARVSSRFGQVFDVSDPVVTQQINYRASELAQSVTQTTYDAIRSVILTGIEDGASIPVIAAGIEGVFAECSAQRALLIARTETIRASADGALAAYESLQRQGLLDGYGKVWLGTDDTRECPTCDGLNGEVVPFEQRFSSGDLAPPNHPRCRCAIGAEPLPAGRSLTPDQARTLLRAVAGGMVRSAELVA